MYVCTPHVSKPVVLNLWAATPPGAHVSDNLHIKYLLYIMIRDSSKIIVMK